MADKIVVLRDGYIEQVGAPLDLYRDPDNKFVAGFIGSPSMNFLDCNVADGRIEHPSLPKPLQTSVSIPATVSRVTVGIRPEHISVNRNGNGLTVELTEALGGVSYTYLRTSAGERLIVEERGDERSATGEDIGLQIDHARALLFDSETGKRLR